MVAPDDNGIRLEDRVSGVGPGGGYCGIRSGVGGKPEDEERCGCENQKGDQDRYEKIPPCWLSEAEIVHVTRITAT